MLPLLSSYSQLIDNFISIHCSHDGKYITAGSENQCVYIWRANPESNNLTVRKDRSSHWEAIKGMLFCLLLAILVKS